MGRMRCTSLAPMRSGMYRCIMERGDGHEEHQYNYYRKLTDEEIKMWFPEEGPNLYPKTIDFDKLTEIENAESS